MAWAANLPQSSRRQREKLPSDRLFNRRLRGWQEEQQNQCTKTPCRKRIKRTVVLLSFENTYASAGGLATVIRYLPAALQGIGERIVFISPFHKNIGSTRDARRGGRFSCVFHRYPVKCNDREFWVTCFEDKTSVFTSYFIAIDGCFESCGSPYAYGDQKHLVRDAFCFSAAVPGVCAKLGFTERITFHAHDWETAPIVLAAREAQRQGVLKRCSSFVTLHNSFDAFADREDYSRFLGIDHRSSSILQTCCGLANGPVTTVSSPFAAELTNDPLQKELFAPHLQSVFAGKGLLGIENGLFGDHSGWFSDEACARARTGDLSLLSEEKNANRRALIEQLAGSSGEDRIGRIRFGPGQRIVPLFFLSGRMDLGQKGFDTVFHAFSRLPKGSAKLFFCPSPGSLSPGDRTWNDTLSFFAEYAKERSGDIEIWPYRLPFEQYQVFLSGADYLLMPSFYEPFGAATEGLIRGTPVVARATGGLILQVLPIKQPPMPSFYDQELENVWSGNSSSGILYRESENRNTDAVQWRQILSTPIHARVGIPLYERMVDALGEGLQSAFKLYRNQQDYLGVILGGREIASNFSWQSAARKYRRIYDLLI